MSSIRSLLLLLVFAPTASAADWPQWLGPNRDGSTSEKVPAWQGDLKKVWTYKVGDGHSSPVVADGLVYVHYAASDKDAEVIDAVNVADGKVKWSFEYPRPPFKNVFGRGPRSTPAIAGGKLYAFGTTGILTCLDAKTGARSGRSTCASNSSRRP